MNLTTSLIVIFFSKFVALCYGSRSTVEDFVWEENHDDTIESQIIHHGKQRRRQMRLFEDDIKLPQNMTIHRNLATIPHDGMLWKNDMRNGYYWITVRISNKFSSAAKQTIVNALRNLQWRSQVIRFDIIYRRPLKLKPYIHLVNGDDGCWSYIGREKEESMLPHGQILMLEESRCAKMRVVQHEMMHALGFGHEQSRPDRDDNVLIVWENIRDDRKDQFLAIEEVDSLGTPYDFDSIMHYGKGAFTKNGGPTIIGLNNNVIGNRMNASWTDILQIRLMYQCKSGPRHLSDYKKQKCSEDCQCWHNEAGCGNNNSFCNDDMICEDNVCILPRDKKSVSYLVNKDLEGKEYYFVPGAMFDIQAKTYPIKITNLYYQGIQGNVWVDIYSKQWTHFKWSENEEKWDLIGSAYLQLTPDNVPTLFPKNTFTPILLERWHRRGFYIQTRDCGTDCNKLRVWLGEHYAENTKPFMENDNVRILEGCALKGKFDNSGQKCNGESRGGESFSFWGGVQYVMEQIV